MSQLPNPDVSIARALSNDVWEWSLRPWWRAVIFLAPLVAGGIWLGALTVRAAQSAYRLDSLSIPAIQNALRHDPDNPDLLHRLGLVYTYDQTNIDIGESLKNLRAAVALNPRRWDYWADLGTSCDFAADTACSDQAFDRAWALNPVTPNLAWALGNHYLLTNRPEKAFPFFRELLNLSPDYLDPTFRLCLRATHDPQLIYSDVLPQGKDGFERFAFLNFLVSTGDYENAMKIWGQMISGPDRSPNLLLVKPFLDFLTDQGRLRDAVAVWGDLQHAGAVPTEPSSPSANLLYNGRFDRLPLNMGFDWRMSSSPDLVFDFSDPSAYKASKCLKIDFSVGRNAEYDLLSQIVTVKPSTSYQLSAFVRTENLTSDSGPRLRVTELGCTDCTAPASDPTQGTMPWHAIDVSFVTRPQTQAVRVAFWRPQASAAIGDITGTVWLDDLNLHAVGSASTDVSQARTR
jgi:tetratricopeptide (TPR) repeat protein